MCGKVKSLNLIIYYIILHLLQYLIYVIKHKNPRTITNGECLSKIMYIFDCNITKNQDVSSYIHQSL